MSKWQEYKQAIQNPPAERIAKIEYKSHFFNIVGVLFVSIILITKGYWYITFAFIFSVGVSYSQGISAYQKYLIIKKINAENPQDVEIDKSPTRRRRKLIEEQLGSWINYLTIFIGIIISYFILNPINTPWYAKVSFTLLIIFIYLIIYYFPVYWLAQIRKNLQRRLNERRSNNRGN